jgi:pimeloyl-ACP methyl ester carboxylesterase
MSSSVKSAIQAEFRTIDGLQIRFAASEPRDEHALLLSPWPESLFAFQPMWERLAGHAHIVAVDLPGFGHAEGRDSLFAPGAMGEFVIRLADEFGLEHPHVVGPDVGTGATLFAAADHPGRIRSLVVGSGGASYPLQLGGMLQDWVIAPDLEALRRVDARQIVSGTLNGPRAIPAPRLCTRGLPVGLRRRPLRPIGRLCTRLPDRAHVRSTSSAPITHPPSTMWTVTKRRRWGASSAAGGDGEVEDRPRRRCLDDPCCCEEQVDAVPRRGAHRSCPRWMSRSGHGAVGPNQQWRMASTIATLTAARGRRCDRGGWG